MKEIFHHLRFDLHRLRWWLLLWFAASVFFGQELPEDELPLPSGPWIAGLVVLLLIMVRQHNPPGDRTWWVSRPVGRKRIALAKAIGVVIVALLWLAGGAIHLMAQGFNPVGVVFFQAEAFPLFVGIGIGLFVLISLTKNWREFLGLSIFCALALTWIILAFEEKKADWIDRTRVEIVDRAQEFPPGLREERTKSAYESALVLYERTLGPWIDWTADAGFLGGVVLVVGFSWALARRFENRLRPAISVSACFLVVGVATVVKMAFVPQPLSRWSVVRPNLSTSDQPIVLRMEEEGVRVSKHELSLPGDGVKTRYSLEIPMTLQNPESLDVGVSFWYSAHFGISKADENTGDQAGDFTAGSGGSWNQLESAWRAMDISNVPETENTLSSSRILAPSWYLENVAGSTMRIAQLTRYRETLTPEGKTSPRIVLSEHERLPYAQIETVGGWSKIPFRSGISEVMGIQRFRIVDELSISDPAEGPENTKQVGSRIQYDELRFRLNRNPALRYFDSGEGDSWRLFLMDGNDSPVGRSLVKMSTSGNGAPKSPKQEPGGLVSRNFHFAVSEETDFDDLYLAIVRRTGGGTRPIEFELPERFQFPTETSEEAP